MNGYHDNCRCLAIECETADDAPQIVKDLQAQAEFLREQKGGKTLTTKDWQEFVDGERAKPRWPKLGYPKTPKYRGDGTSKVFGGEPLPSLERMPGHVLFGWRDEKLGDKRWVPHVPSARRGHRWNSERPNATTFPRSWSDQKIVDAVRDTIEEPDDVVKMNRRRISYRKIGDIYVKAEYSVVDGEALPNSVTAYPVTKSEYEKGVRNGR
ncbi:EndoU domain-containing protein [Corynebacterium sp. TAE3-ERU12]|uniref:EndoU domain-containing protein n=1 Tax=Corynebacterium sp. TAE3-ERU12 TaxID=2849491 RepID=UPI001C45A27D|nr:EndoU domain-containing protein [Corynebacterium sp. TAE3-ERU12]MBV7294899.1 EndoU domain-containing protein [Corynebacterium sp. TAE3-ERU12]